MTEIANEQEEVTAPEEETETVEAPEAAEEEAPATSEKEGRASKRQAKKTEAALAQAQADLEKSQAELAEANDRYLRLLAEYDNYRRRTQKEKESIYGDAYTDAVSKILPIIDNMELAMLQSADADAAQLLRGFEMILKAATENLGKMNVTAFGAVGEEFDPNRHTAVFHVEDESLGENVISEVLQKGYERDGKIIRYAVVKVAN